MTGGGAGPALHLRAVCLPDEAERDMWVRDGRLTFEPVPGAQTVGRRGYAVPGLVDAHCHIGLTPGGAAGGAHMVHQAHTERDAGALLLRDCGVPTDNSALVDRPDLPRIIRAGQHLARPKRYIAGLGIELEPHELVGAVEEQVRYGDGRWIKLVGDWIDRSVGDLAPLWPADVLRSAVDRAHELGARVAVHTFGEEALPDLLAAGVDSIEHGTGLTDDTIAAAAQRGTALVPTVLNIGNFPGIAAAATKYPVYAERMRRLHASAAERFRAAFEAGVPVYAGTDAGGMILNGRIAEEIRALADLGMPADRALAAGSWAARAWLGLAGLEEGAPADVVVYDTDPRADLAVLAAPARIVLRGRVVR